MERGNRRESGVQRKKLESLEFGALLHDIGMIASKDEIFINRTA